MNVTDAIKWHEEQVAICANEIEDTIMYLVREESKAEPDPRVLQTLEVRLAGWREEKLEHETSLCDLEYHLTENDYQTIAAAHQAAYTLF